MGAAPEPIDVDVADVELLDPHGQPLSLGALPGVQVVVLMRHRH